MEQEGTFFTEHLRVTVSDPSKINLYGWCYMRLTQLINEVHSIVRQQNLLWIEI